MHARTRDDINIDYTLFGESRATHKVALVHSLAMDRSFCAPVILELGESCSVLAFDCRGHGRSGKPAGPYSIDTFADDLADLLAHVGWEKAVVAGASMGGAVSLAFAQRYPQCVAGLGLFDTTAWYGATAQKDWADRASKALTEGLPSLVAFQKTRWFSEAFCAKHPAIVKSALDVFLRNDVSAYEATCNMLGATDLREGLSNLSMQVRIAVGEEDYATPVAMSEQLHAAIPGSTLTILKGARHLTPLEAPQAIAAELRALMR